MLVRAIRTALATEVIDRVLVSTDSPEIAAVAREAGAQAPFLRAAAADDRTPVSEATAVAVEEWCAHGSPAPDVVVQLMANCPFRTSRTIQDFVERLHTEGAEAAVSVFEPRFGSPGWAVRLDVDGRPEPLSPEFRFARSQDLPAFYCPTGTIWAARCGTLLEQRTFYATNHRLYPVPWLDAIDIDTPEELQFARWLADGGGL